MSDLGVRLERWHWLWVGARRYFLAGLAIILPSFLTLYILWFLWGVVETLLAPVTQIVLRPVFGRDQFPILVTWLSALVAGAVVWLIGFTGAAFSRRLFDRAELAIGRIPFVSGIHRTVKQLLHLFTASDSSLRQVALIEYPRKGLYCLCFITNASRWTLPPDGGRRAVPVFIPTTPNPTSGFLLLVPEDDVIALDLSVDEAIKVIISGGLISPPSRDLPEAPLPGNHAG